MEVELCKVMEQIQIKWAQMDQKLKSQSSMEILSVKFSCQKHKKAYKKCHWNVIRSNYMAFIFRNLKETKH